MSAQDERVHLFKLHPCARGLSEEAVREIAESAEVIHCRPGDCVQKAGEPITSLYLIIHGRMRVTLLDIQGRIHLQRYHGSGDQFGGMAAALGEPAPMEFFAEDPSTLLKFDYLKSQELAKKDDALRLNFARAMAETVKRTLFNDRLPNRPHLVAFFHQTDETRVITHKLFRRLVELGETPAVLTDRAEAETIAGIQTYRILGGDRDFSPQEVTSQVAQWLEKGRVFADVATSIEPARAANALEKFVSIYWCVTPQNWRDSVQPLKELESRAPGWREKIRIVWLLGPSQVAPVANELRELAGRDVKISTGSPIPHHGKVELNGFERLLHLVRGIQIGVALGGGAARGMAHLGVLKALEQSGIVVDMIAGTSAGAMTGTLYSAGLDPDYLVDSFVRDLRPSWPFRFLPRGDQWYLLYKYRMGRFDPMLRKYLKENCMEQLALPMHTVTVDLIRGESVVRSAGDAVHGILESINLPVLSKPIIRPGQALVDGGLINNIPADVLVAKGCNFVIAVSVTAKMESEFARNRPDTPIAHMRSASVIQTVLRSFLVQSSSVNAIGVAPADFVIEPDVTGFELTEFTRTDELAAIGEETTLRAIPQVKQLLNRLDGALFPPIATS
ncbi:MAG: cyclic nucleotide-binding and patatin-like phospholipase domain-containing protein [Bythopirellula sp.]|nr:cyclic nucleotide-binding and patatin-like phospholipase domain-containing protein [Bythopirellula sp.]